MESDLSDQAASCLEMMNKYEKQLLIPVSATGEKIPIPTGFDCESVAIIMARSKGSGDSSSKDSMEGDEQESDNGSDLDNCPDSPFETIYGIPFPKVRTQNSKNIRALCLRVLRQSPTTLSGDDNGGNESI
jgi:hypothetical protein